MKMLRIALVATAALATAAPVFAQPQPTQQYQRDMRNYDRDQANYANDRAAYDQARRDYEVRRDKYERDRDRYDRRYGSGSYARRYGAAPNWDNSAYDRNSAYNNSGYNDPCQDKRTNNTVAGGLIGALAGAALGSNVAARNARTEGTVLGALVGGAIGAGVGRANANAKCDTAGYYYSYDQTVPYRESQYDRGRRSGQYNYSYYNRQQCRLAPAPVNGEEYRYVRVCPDREGRFRITG